MGKTATVVGKKGAGVPAKGWRKSSHSMTNGHCIETACFEIGLVRVRDSVVPNGPELLFNSSAWTSFIAGLRMSSRC